MHQLIAQFSPEVTPMTLLVAYGPMGVMLAWFMWRFETMIKAFRRLSHQIEGMTKAMLVDVMSRPSTSAPTRKVATDLLAEMELRSSRPLSG